MKQTPLPLEMNAIEIKDGSLVPARRAVPKPGKGEVLIRVHAAGINRPDILQRKGLYPPPPGVTDIPGLEVAGEIVAVGKGAKKRKRGEKVCALLSGGGYAEFAVAPEAQCLPVPGKMSLVAAACLPETFFTVWTNLFDRGRLRKGECVLVHGGASGIGTTAIQLAKAFGARVFATAGSDRKCRACKNLGAAAAINYRTQDFVAEIGKLTKNGGVDIVLDMVGGDYVIRNLKALGEGGRHVSIAMQRGRTAEIDIFQIMSKRLALTGSTLRPRSVREKGDIAKALLRQVWPLLKKKRVAPVIDKVFALKDAQKAHDYLELGDHFGKIVLRVL